jgi:hypothetical protein
VADQREQERSPREEMIVQAIGLAAITLAAVLAPMVERMMSDPDVGYRIRWHARHLGHLIELRLHEAGLMIETAVGLYQIQEDLRKAWRNGNETRVGSSDSEGDRGGPDQ